MFGDLGKAIEGLVTAVGDGLVEAAEATGDFVVDAGKGTLEVLKATADIVVEAGNEAWSGVEATADFLEKFGSEAGPAASKAISEVLAGLESLSQEVETHADAMRRAWDGLPDWQKALILAGLAEVTGLELFNSQ